MPFIVGAFTGLVLGIIIGIEAQLEVAGVAACEADLPRSQHCVLIAVPEAE